MNESLILNRFDNIEIANEKMPRYNTGEVICIDNKFWRVVTVIHYYDSKRITYYVEDVVVSTTGNINQ